MTRVLNRLTTGLRVLRPRAMTEMRKSLADSKTDLRRLTDAVTTLSQSVVALERSVREQSVELTALRQRESQLRAVAERNLDLAHRTAALDALLDEAAIRLHVGGAISHATLHGAPFPHIVVDRVLPDPVYDALMAGLPPAELFEDRPANKQELHVPLHLAPDYSRRVWLFMSDVIVRTMITPMVIEKFRPPLNAWIRETFSVASADPLSSINVVSSDGRILRRTRGYHIRPHRDPKWGFIVCILYLALPGDDSTWGTDLFEVKQDGDVRGAEPYWIDDMRCRRVSTVDFHRNRLLVFMNATGAHGARIPADAEPPTLQRHIYQFRLGPDAVSVARLNASLPPERRELWEAKQRTQRR